MNKFYSIINYIKQKKIASKFSEEFLKENLISLLHNILSGKNIDDEIENFYRILVSSKNQYFILSEIENIKIFDNETFVLVDSTIKILQEEDIPFNKGTFQGLEEDKYFELVGKPCIFTRVEAGDNGKAIDLALHNFTISFNLLRLHIPSFKPSLKGTLISGKQRLLPHNKTENSTLLYTQTEISILSYNQTKKNINHENIFIVTLSTVTLC